MSSSDQHGVGRHNRDGHHPDGYDPDTYEVAERRAVARALFTASCVLLLHGRRHPAGSLDISEVGLGCIVEPQPDLPEIRPDLAVTVCLTLDDAVLELGAVIVRAAPTADGKVALGMHLRGVSERDRDQIREHVYARLHALRVSGQL
jgi:hypothetical protein